MRAKWSIAFLFFSIICIGFSGISQAQDDLEAMFDDMDQTFRDMEKQLEEIDREFTKYLAQEWKQMDMLEGMTKFEVPKPVKLPPAPDETPPSPTTDQKKAIVKPAPIIAPAAVPVATVRPKPGPGQALDFNFYGQPVSIKYNPKVKSAKAPAVNNRGIAAYWAAMGSADPDNLVGQFQHYKNQLALNDWGYFMLVHMAGEKLYGGDANQANLFSWFVLTKSGYHTRIGISGNRILLFGTSMTTMYGSPFLTIGGNRFYSLSTRGPVKRFGRLYTYQGNYPKSGRSMTSASPITPT